MKTISAFLNTPTGHVATGYALLAASSAVRLMPAPRPNGSPLYLWFYGLVHLAMFNFDKTGISISMTAPAAASAPVAPVPVASAPVVVPAPAPPASESK